ncbi:hypothetical protein D3C85_816000 [compost metagenome]
MGAAGIQKDKLILLYYLQCRQGQRLLLADLVLAALGQGTGLWRQRNRAAMDALAAPLIGEMAQIAPDRRLSGTELWRQVCRHHLVV